MDQPRSLKGLIIAAIAVGAVLITALAMLASGRPEQAVVTTDAAVSAVPPAPKSDSTEATDPAAKLKWHPEPVPAAATVFQDADGADHTLADFAGQVLVVNFWATWCAPCIKEMPTLERLQQKLGGPAFRVLAISQDREGLAVAKPFVDENDWRDLPLYVEPNARFARDAALRGLPTTIVIDKQGREVARLEGTTEWDAPEIAGLLAPLIAAAP